MVLLAGAGLLLRSLHRLQSVDPGFEPKDLLTFRLTLPMNRYRDIPRRTAFFGDGARRAVRAAGRDLGGGHQRAALRPERPGAAELPRSKARRRRAGPRARRDEPRRDPDYFRTLGIPLRRGRALEPTDVAAAEPVGVVNDAAVRQLFHGKDPIGRRVAWARAEPPRVDPVVGVAGDVRGDGLDADDAPALYTPMAQESRPWRTWMNVVVRSSRPPACPRRLRQARGGRAWTRTSPSRACAP